MIHAAIMGSIERFLSVLIEHYAGAFPLWLAPVQAAVITISENQQAWAELVVHKLRHAGIRAELHNQNETLGKKIRTQNVHHCINIGLVNILTTIWDHGAPAKSFKAPDTTGLFSSSNLLDGGIQPMQLVDCEKLGIVARVILEPLGNWLATLTHSVSRVVHL